MSNDFFYSVNDTQVFTVTPGDAEIEAGVWSGEVVDGMFSPSHPVSLSYAVGNLTSDDEFSLVWLAKVYANQAGPEGDSLRGQLARGSW